MLIKYRLVNIEGFTKLVTRHGDFYVDIITDAEAEKLFYDGSRYVEQVPEILAIATPAAEVPAVVKVRKSKKQ